MIRDTGREPDGLVRIRYSTFGRYNLYVYLRIRVVITTKKAP